MSWRAELLTVQAVAARNLVMGMRNVFFFFELLFWPIVGVLSIGLMTRFLGLTPEQGAFVLVGTLALSIVNVCQLEVAYAMLLDVWSKSVKHQFMAPIGVRHLTLGSWLIGILRGFIIFVLLAVLAGIYYPISVLPKPVAALAAAIPLTYFLDAYRTHFGFRSEFAAPVATGLALSALYVVLAHWAFRHAIERARRTGLLLKMSE